MTYADANLLIKAAIEKEEIGKDARLILEAGAEGKVNLETSSLTFDEVMWAILKVADRESTLKATEKLAKSVAVVFDVSMDVIYETFEVFKHTRLAPRDAIHAACMRFYGVNEIISDDSDFDKIPGIKRFTISEFARRLKHER